MEMLHQQHGGKGICAVVSNIQVIAAAPFIRCVANYCLRNIIGQASRMQKNAINESLTANVQVIEELAKFQKASLSDTSRGACPKRNDRATVLAGPFDRKDPSGENVKPQLQLSKKDCKPD